MSWSVALYSAAESPHIGRIEFNEAKHTRGEFKCRAMAEIDGEEWSVSLAMIEPYRADMLAYFEELASAAWSGDNWWESEDAEMRLVAKVVDEQLVRLSVTMWWASYDESGSGEILVRRDQLPRVAREMSEFLRLERGSRFPPGAYGRGRP